LAEFIEDEPGLKVCGQASGITEALKLLNTVSPDVLVVDLKLKDGSGFELIKQVRVLSKSIRMLVLSMYDETMYAERALRAGAMGYITKEEASDKVVEAVRQVLRGEVYLSDQMSVRMLKDVTMGNPRRAGSPLEALSDRELEVFELIGHAQGTRQIADRLHLSVKTIETHRESIKRKLKLRGNLELIRSAMHWVFEQSNATQDLTDGEP
jgi:DNA-binding NarL/FixJ family response regulator